MQGGSGEGKELATGLFTRDFAEVHKHVPRVTGRSSIWTFPI